MNKGKQDSEPIKKPTKFDWDSYWERRATYHWQYISAHDHQYYEYSLKDCIEVQLFKHPENKVIDPFWENNKWQQNLIGEFFYEAFKDWAFHERAQLKDLFTRLLIPIEIYHEILNKINDFKLLHIKDLLLETIAISQYIITNELRFWNSPENLKLRMTAQAETENAIKVIELSGVYHESIKSMRENPSPGLSSITFKFTDASKIQIQHKWLAEEFVYHLMRYYDELKNKDWRKDLARYPERFVQNHLKNSFQKQIAQAYFELFKENNLFESKTNKPSKMMRCIVCMLEFSLSPIGGEEDNTEFDKGKTEFDKGKVVAELLRQLTLKKLRWVQP